MASISANTAPLSVLLTGGWPRFGSSRHTLSAFHSVFSFDRIHLPPCFMFLSHLGVCRASAAQVEQHGPRGPAEHAYYRCVLRLFATMHLTHRKRPANALLLLVPPLPQAWL